MKKLNVTNLLFLFVVLFFTQSIILGQNSVKIWEEPLTLPTYLVEPPDKNPMFFKNESYQGASRYIYPYALLDNITNKKSDKTYKALYLENEYIKLCVIPEIGGRLFYATDKTNGYEIFYRQHVIKPSGIGMLGPWISGGVEFSVFHHHRASTFMPVDYTLVQNEDGSATIWIGETEPRHRMKWTIGISLFPGKSYIEADGRLINSTENINSILYWANVATHANDDYQVIFPSGTDFAVYHAKISFCHWPITTEEYVGKEYYKDSIDASWWKNHPRPISLFAHEIKDDFLAGYDFGKNAGVMHVGNHHIIKGAKLWEWGPGAYGAMWDSKVLTDNDGPYLELMSGAYSDNQPDYSWLKPYEVKTFKQHWYPLRNTQGASAANLKVAVNLKKIGENDILIAANATQIFNEVNVCLKKNDQIIFEKEINISPENPFFHTISIEKNWKENELHLILKDKTGGELISYKPIKKKTGLPLPEPVIPPVSPEQINTIEELYLTGLRIKQFHNARLNPDIYFLEALRRDPLDIRSNTQMGIISKEDGKFDESATYFRTALKRLTADYTKPQNCEPFYHLGLILQAQGKYEAAYDTLYRAAWDQSFASPAYFHLAQISSIRKDYERALEEISRSLDYNSSNLNSLNLKTSLLRETGNIDQAKELAGKVLKKDILNFWAQNELVLISGDNDEKENLKKLMRDNPESYIELAVGYLNSGLHTEAKNILLTAANSGNKRLSRYPTIHYYLGFLYDNEENSEKAGYHFNLGKSLSTDYCFPFRLETINIYKTALKRDASDSRAFYYLGNLLYDRQPEKAIDFWEKTVQLEPELAIAHRNLGWGYNHSRNDLDKAITSYEEAIKNDKTQARYYYELDKLYEKNGTSIDIRHKLLTANHEFVAKRADAILQEIQVLSLIGEYKKAIDYLKSTFFSRQEGFDNIHEIYVDACLGQGILELNSGNNEQAKLYFEMADEYPENHQMSREDDYEKNAQVLYFQAIADERLQKLEDADQLFRKISGLKITSSEFNYYKAMALIKSGNTKEAEKLTKEIIRSGQELISKAGEVDFFSKFGEEQSNIIRKSNGYYLLGLAELIGGKEKKAVEFFDTAFQLNPNHLWAKHYLNELK